MKTPKDIPQIYRTVLDGVNLSIQIFSIASSQQFEHLYMTIRFLTQHCFVPSISIKKIKEPKKLQLIGTFEKYLFDSDR